MSLRKTISSKIIESELSSLFVNGISVIGNLIGRGVCRHVYECKENKDIVIKIEPYAKDFQNVKEWNVWQQFKNFNEVSDRLAPCIDISPCGVVLIQKKCDKVVTFPEYLPEFMTNDPTYQNFGLLEGRLVLIDYGQFEFKINTDVVKLDCYQQQKINEEIFYLNTL